MQTRHSILFGITAILVMVISVPAKAQQPVLVQNQDTTYFNENLMLDEILVTANQFSNSKSIDHFITNSELNTSVSGITKNLQRDLPSLIRLYTPQGIPMLTKYTSNNSLTSTLPDSAIGLELRKPSAKFPNPDAPVIIQPNYRQRGSISLSPLNQSVIIANDTKDMIAGNLALSRSGSTEMFETLVPELQAYNSTYAGYGGGRIDLGKSQTEAIIHLYNSENEYGNLLGIEKYEEVDRSANLFVQTRYTLSNQTLHAGFAHQIGREQRWVEEIKENNELINYEETNEIDATSFTAAISDNSTELRANFRDLQRVYPYGPEGTVHTQRLEAVFIQKQDLFSVADLTTEARYDFNDKEPSVSGKLQTDIHSKFMVNLNAGRLYDAVGSEGLNSLMRNVQMGPHPWETTFIRFGTEYSHEQANLDASVTHKKVRRGWYGDTAYNRGWIARLGGHGLLYNEDQFYVRWNLEGIARNLSLDISDQPSQMMPGPARLEGHASLESGIGNMEYSILTDIFIDRKMRINNNVTGDLGSQYFLSISASRKIGMLEMEATLNNGLALLGKKNKIIAHFSETGMKYVSAPPVINISVGINFY